MPSSYGEDAVIRVLDRTKLAEDHTGLTLERLQDEPKFAEIAPALLEFITTKEVEVSRF